MKSMRRKLSDGEISRVEYNNWWAKNRGYSNFNEYYHEYRHGNRLERLKKSIEERFWSHVEIKEEDKCWNWKGALNNKGYGVLGVGGKKIAYAHRIAYELAKGKIPKDKYVLHSCDNPSCCNHKHLLLGNHQDNMDDMVKKGRRYAKLTIDNVKEIRLRLMWTSNKLSKQEKKTILTELATKFNVTKRHIIKIAKNKLWTNVQRFK